MYMCTYTYVYIYNMQSYERMNVYQTVVAPRDHVFETIEYGRRIKGAGILHQYPLFLRYINFQCLI